MDKKNVDVTLVNPFLGAAFEIHLLDQTTLSTDMSSPFGEMQINVAIKTI